MRTSATFTKAFFSAVPMKDVAGPSQQAQQKQTPSTYSPEVHGSVDDFMLSTDFGKFKQDYIDLLDRITAFVHDHANKLNPPLLDDTKKKVQDDFDVLKQHLFDSQEDYFGRYKPEVYGVGKEMFHAFEELLQHERLPLQQRINAVVELAPRTRMCSGGLLSDLQEVTAALKAANHGMQGMVHQWKKKMMEALILEHVKATHVYSSISEIHFGNVYYNKLAEEMGVKKRVDPLVNLYEEDISEEDLAQCKAHVFSKLKPIGLAAQISDQYRNRIEESLGQEKIDPDKIGADGLDKLNTTLRALNSEYGEVSPHHFLEPVKEDWSEIAYTGAKRPTVTTRHFLKQLKKQGMIDYDKKSKLVLGKADESRVVMLDDLLWLKNQDGEIQEFTASAFFKVAPKEFLDNLEKIEADTQKRSQLLDALVGRVQESLDATGSADDALGTWLRDFAMEMKERPSWGEDRITPLMLLAVTFNQATVLPDLLKAGGSKNARDEKSGQTALILAVRKGHAEVMNLLIEVKADVNAVDREGNTALMIAVLSGNAGAICSLGKARADIEAKNNKGDTALMLAVSEGKTEMVRPLKDAGADMEARNDDGETALMRAASDENIEMVKALKEAGADIDAKDSFGYTSLISAVAMGKSKLVEALIEIGADIEARTDYGKTALMLAVITDRNEVAKTLMNAGADIEARDDEGNTTLLFAVSYGKTELAKDLIERGADIEVKNNEGNTALLLAAQEGNVEIAKMLILRGIDTIAPLRDAKQKLFLKQLVGCWVDRDEARVIETLHQAGAAVLQELARKGDTPVLKYLIEAGADKFKDAQGKTALMRAVDMVASDGEDGVRALKALLKAGANITMKDNEGMTAKDHAGELAAASQSENAFLALELLAFAEADLPRNSASSWRFRN